MKIRELFKKEIDRPIQGVVKIGQDSSDIIREELDEYVVTRELNKHFDRFFENYRKGTQNKTDKMGVWISGFFGSGKSHFLKILSYLLSNDSFDGKKAISYFDDKVMDSRILADMKVAGDTSADVILFNIDAKSDADAKTNKDAIVKVFMKVFNEMQGLCSSMPWIADLERQMVKDGVYEEFKISFKELSGNDWEYSREDFYFEEDSIIAALSKTTKMSGDAARSWYNKSEANYSLDVTQFAIKVREYIEIKSKELGKKHFVVFLCDEIGQYIGSDDNLMLNLQTVVEQLGTECGGRAWVIATSQQDIDSITKVNRDNFSKIIGRFDTRLSLSSANVDEVIKKRLLAKKDTAKDKLKLTYADKNAIIKNLITFSQDTPEKKLYINEDDFVDVYPFIPYQFNLLQAVFTGIRTHGASGKHLSEGERSLLNAFQEAAIEFGSFDDGTLIPFDAFYKTIETFLDHNIRTVFIHAEANGNLLPDDIAVLKVLFMIKYIRDVLPPNIENITTLMLQNIDEDKIATGKRIDACLRRLEAEKLITKNGVEYIFLTNEEQDINREIREIKIDTAEIIDRVGDEIFNALFGLNKKYRYGAGYDFPFNSIIDDRARGAQKDEIGIRVITPYYVGRGEHELKSLSMRERNVIVCLPPDMTFIDEMEQALQIDTFIRKNSGKTSTDIVEDIKTTKIREAKQRRDRCKNLIVEALKKADIYVSANKLDIKEKLPTERINDAFKALIDVTYTKLGYIKAPFFTNDDLRKVLSNQVTQITLDGTNDVPNRLALEEMMDIINRKAYQSLQTTMKTLIDIFVKAPYGWNDMDVSGLILMLFKNGEIRLELGGETIPPTDYAAVDYVTKRDYLDRLLIKVRVKVSPALLTNAKNLAKEIFIVSDMPSDEDGIMTRFKELASGELYRRDGNIKDLLSEYNHGRYPGKAVLDGGKKLFEELIKIKDIKAFFDYLNSEKDAFLDYEDDVSDVRKFFASQKTIFDNAIKMLDIYEGNRSYVLDADTIKIVADMEKITKLASPYSEIHKLSDLIENFRNLFSSLLNAECEPIQRDIEADNATVRAEMESKSLSSVFGEKVRTEFSSLLERLERANNIYEAIAMRTESDRLKLRFIDEFIKEEARQKAASGDEQPDAPIVPTHKVKTISVKTLFSGTSQVSNRDDIEKLTDELKEKLIAQLDENTTIKIV